MSGPGQTDNSLAPMIEGATFVGDKACLDCHANIAKVLIV